MKIPRILFYFFVILLMGSACQKKENPGVEAGNPIPPTKVEGAQLRLSPSEGEEDYVVTILDSQRARISQIKVRVSQAPFLSVTIDSKSIVSLLEEVIVPYTVTGDILSLEARFLNGRQVRISSTISGSGDILTAKIEFSGKDVTADFSDNAGSDVVETICDKVVSCVPSLQPSECQQNLLRLTQLNSEFGSLPGNLAKFQDVVTAIEARKFTFNPSNLLQCLEDLKGISCEALINVFRDPSLANIGTLIPDGQNTCKGVF